MFRILRIAIIVSIILQGPVHATDFLVSTVAELETALAAAAGNGDDDTITLVSGIYYPTATLTYNSFEDNAITLQGDGGDVVIDGSSSNHRLLLVRSYSSNADITIRELVLTNGYSPEGNSGGGMLVNISSADLVLENLSITDCAAPAFYFTNNGGGAYITAGGSANVLIRNCVVDGNRTKGYGGGLYISLTSGTLWFINNTVINNTNETSVEEGGGGIYLRLFYEDSMAYLYNNILWGNTYANNVDGDLYVEDNGDVTLYPEDVDPAPFNMTNNDVGQMAVNLGGAMTVSGNISQDPGLSEDYHLDLTSVCLDAGSPAAPNISDKDFEGDPRSHDGDCTGGGSPDMGADEYYEPPTVVTVSVSGSTATSVTVSGNIPDAGGHPVTEKGVCWSMSPDPSLADSSQAEGAGTGSFSSTLTGLVTGAAYHARAYGTSCEGTSYGDDISFIPQSPEVSFSDAEQSGGENAGILTVSAVLSFVSGLDVTVPLTLGGSADPGSGKDYSASPNPVLIPAGSTSSSISITINDDALIESDETIILTMDEPTNASLGSLTIHTVTIVENDSCPDCTQSHVTLQNLTFASGCDCECVSSGSISVGPGITVEASARVRLRAPAILFSSGVDIHAGADFRSSQ